MEAAKWLIDIKRDFKLSDVDIKDLMDSIQKEAEVKGWGWSADIIVKALGGAFKDWPISPLDILVNSFKMPFKEIPTTLNTVNPIVRGILLFRLKKGI